MKAARIQQTAERILQNNVAMHVYLEAGTRNRQSHQLQKALMALGCRVTNRTCYAV